MRKRHRRSGIVWGAVGILAVVSTLGFTFFLSPFTRVGGVRVGVSSPAQLEARIEQLPRKYSVEISSGTRLESLNFALCGIRFDAKSKAASVWSQRWQDFKMPGKNHALNPQVELDKLQSCLVEKGLTTAATSANITFFFDEPYARTTPDIQGSGIDPVELKNTIEALSIQYSGSQKITIRSSGQFDAVFTTPEATQLTARFNDFSSTAKEPALFLEDGTHVDVAWSSLSLCMQLENTGVGEVPKLGAIPNCLLRLVERYGGAAAAPDISIAQTNDIRFLSGGQPGRILKNPEELSTRLSTWVESQEKTDLAFKEVGLTYVSQSKQQIRLSTVTAFDIATLITQNTPSTGTVWEGAVSDDPEVAARIEAVAASRGFKKRADAGTKVVIVDGVTLAPEALASWKQLQARARADGITLNIVSSYRSPDSQFKLFNDRLAQNGGNSTESITKTLEVTAPAGYSRHHLGTVVDFGCGEETGTFASTNCYRWLSADNFALSRAFGWLPSYPDGAENQGPEPEPWEFIYVGPAAWGAEP